MQVLRGVAVGAGYFSQFHFDAWSRVPGVELVALCDNDLLRAREAAKHFGVPKVYAEVATMLDEEHPDFIDIISPPDTHRRFSALAGERGVHILCQKPLAPSLDEAAALIEDAERAGIRLMVHDNFRFQPWHRQLRKLLEQDAIGKLHSIACRTRLGDGWKSDAYLARQPYFRAMPRLLIFETGVHFIDLYRYLAGEVRQVYARLRRLNSAIVGEDTGFVVFEFETGGCGIWDANRFNESLNSDPRFTFGEFLLEGDGGALRLDEDGRILIHRLGERASEHRYALERRGFAGDCVFATFEHFVDGLRSGKPFETEGRTYLKTLAVQEAIYRSALTNLPVQVLYPA